MLTTAFADAWNLVDRRKTYHSNGKMTIAEELGPLAMGSLFKAVARNAEVVEQEVDFHEQDEEYGETRD